jgi:carbonic anhydrase
MALEQEGVRVSIGNLETFPFVRKGLDEGTLSIHGAVFSIADGKLRVLEDSGAFVPA